MNAMKSFLPLLIAVLLNQAQAPVPVNIAKDIEEDIHKGASMSESDPTREDHTGPLIIHHHAKPEKKSFKEKALEGLVTTSVIGGTVIAGVDLHHSIEIKENSDQQVDLLRDINSTLAKQDAKEDSGKANLKSSATNDTVTPSSNPSPSNALQEIEEVEVPEPSPATTPASNDSDDLNFS